MNFNKLMTNIGITENDAAFLSSLHAILCNDPEFSIEFSRIRSACENLDSDTGSAGIARLAERMQLPVHGVEAVCLLLLGVEAKARYDALGISEEIYFDAMADITTWMRMCRKETGEIGTLDNFGWLMQPMKPRIIKLGRLQFEMIVLSAPPKPGEHLQYLDAMPGNIPNGIPALNVHIPEGEPLSHDACLVSYARAKTFFSERFGFNPQYFCCHSWLLAPELKEILPQTSRILAFAADYEILCTDPDADAAWRIFGSKKPWPQETALQRAAKAWYDRGNRIGAGLGIRKV